MKTLSLLIILLFGHSALFGADTLLINSRKGRRERILLFEGRYWIKCNIVSYRNRFFKTKTNYIEFSAGIYYEKDSVIYFRNPPLEDSVKNDYFVWPAGRAGPSLVINSELLVQFLFNQAIKVEFTEGYVSLSFQGKIKGNGKINLKGKRQRNKTFQITVI